MKHTKEMIMRIRLRSYSNDGVLLYYEYIIQIQSTLDRKDKKLATL